MEEDSVSVAVQEVVEFAGDVAVVERVTTKTALPYKAHTAVSPPYILPMLVYPAVIVIL